MLDYFGYDGFLQIWVNGFIKLKYTKLEWSFLFESIQYSKYFITGTENETKYKFQNRVIKNRDPHFCIID